MLKCKTISIDNNNKGFTLIEVLLAIFLFAIAMTTIFTSFTSVLTSSQKVRQSIEEIETARHCFDRITRDLRTLFLPPTFEEKKITDPENPYSFIGDTDTLSFPASSHLMFADEYLEKQRIEEEMKELRKEFAYSDEEGELSYSALMLHNKKHKYENNLAMIYYYLSENDNQNFLYSLMRSDILFNDERRPTLGFQDSENDYAVCSNIKSMEIYYIDKNGSEHSSWDSNSQTSDFVPSAVAINLELQGKYSVRNFRTKITLPVKNIEDEDE